MEISWNFTYAERDLSSPKTTVPILVDAVTESARAYSYNSYYSMYLLFFFKSSADA